MIVIVRPEPSLPSSLAFFQQRGLECCGVAVQRIRTIEIPSAEHSLLTSLTPSVVIVTSQYAAPAAIEYLDHIEWDGANRLIAIGSKTQAALGKYAGQSDSPSTQTSEGILAEFSDAFNPTASIVIFKGVGGRNELEKAFVQLGARVQSLTVYERLAKPLSGDEIKLLERAKCIVATNAESIEILIKADASIGLADKQWIVPSARVAEIAANYGIKTIHLSAGASDAALLKCIHQILE